MKLEHYFEKSGQSPREFAEKIGVTAVTVGRYISGKRIPVKEEMRKIYDETGGLVTANDFHEHSPVPSSKLSL